MSIDVERLSFSYGAHPVLRDVSFRAEPGQLGAVLGLSRAGKSSLFRCMLGFLPHYQGNTSLCGRDVRHLPRRELARLAAYIPQSSQPLFDYTVRDTVLMGAAGGLEPLRQPGRQQLETAQRMMELVGIAPLADRGIRRISGGERQRLSIARAFLKNAPVILLDESTASIDPENETRIQQAISRLIENKTVLIIAHKLRTVAGCDKIVVLEQGNVAEEGTHDALMKENGLYHRLYTLQNESLIWKVRT